MIVKYILLRLEIILQIVLVLVVYTFYCNVIRNFRFYHCDMKGNTVPFNRISWEKNDYCKLCSSKLLTVTKTVVILKSFVTIESSHLVSTMG